MGSDFEDILQELSVDVFFFATLQGCQVQLDLLWVLMGSLLSSCLTEQSVT